MTKIKGPDNSGALFDAIMKKQKHTRDYMLAAYLGQPKSAISQIRTGKRKISAQLLVHICELTGMSLKAAQAKIADRAP